MFGKFPRLTSATVWDFCPHPSDQFHNRELGEGCLMHQGHTQTHELMLSVIIQHQSHSSIAADAPTPTPSQKVTDGTEVLECYCPSLLLDGVCVCVIMDQSGVVLSPPKDTDTANIQIVHIFITLAERTHVPTLQLFETCELLHTRTPNRTDSSTMSCQTFAEVFFFLNTL